MDDLKLEFRAAGRKGEEAIEVDATGLIPGDFITIRVGPALEPDEIRLTSYGDGRYGLSAGKSYSEAVTGERYASTGVSGLNTAMIDFHTKREPKAEGAEA